MRPSRRRRPRALDQPDRQPARGHPYPVTITQYIYPSSPFAEGDAVTVKVDPADPDVVMIFGKG